MPLPHFQRNARIRVFVNFKDADNEPGNPTNVVFKVRTPAESVTTYSTVVNQTTGRYYADVDLVNVGRWEYRWEGTGNIVAASEGSVFVEPSNF